MGSYLEIWAKTGPQLVPLSGERLALGKAKSNDLALDEPSVSRLHAVLERYPSGWCIRDLASRNGTFVNGERLVGEAAVRDGDEIRLGSLRCVFRDQSMERQTATAPSQAAPDLTRREREVLVELCRPLLAGDVFKGPASIRDIAERLVVTEAAVRQHLLRLSDKFGVYEEGERRRVGLANEAVRRGAVSLGDLRERG